MSIHRTVDFPKDCEPQIDDPTTFMIVISPIILHDDSSRLSSIYPFLAIIFFSLNLYFFLVKLSKYLLNVFTTAQKY